MSSSNKKNGHTSFNIFTLLRLHSTSAFLWADTNMTTGVVAAKYKLKEKGNIPEIIQRNNMNIPAFSRSTSSATHPPGTVCIAEFLSAAKNTGLSMDTSV